MLNPNRAISPNGGARAGQLAPRSGSAKSKIILMGKSGAGKTSMRSIIFANLLARETPDLPVTMSSQRVSVSFLGDLLLSLWDCGGQDSFYSSYFGGQRDYVFGYVRMMVYVFDIESTTLEKDFEQFQESMAALEEQSPGAQVVVLVHKMDVILNKSERDAVFEARKELIQERIGENRRDEIEIFSTNIWDETLYKAWSFIVRALIPDIDMLERKVHEFARLCEAAEVVLFERSTFLVIAHSTLSDQTDGDRFEKMSNIIKQFKLSCSHSKTTFSQMEVENSLFRAVIKDFTSQTFLMVIMSKPDENDATRVNIRPGVTLVNIEAATSSFEKFLTKTMKSAIDRDAKEKF